MTKFGHSVQSDLKWLLQITWKKIVQKYFGNHNLIGLFIMNVESPTYSSFYSMFEMMKRDSMCLFGM